MNQIFIVKKIISSSANDDGSGTTRSETGDANGQITGFYIIKGLDGQDRRVDYIADENGFRAQVTTSEMGTVSHEPDSAAYLSNAPSAESLQALWEQAGGNREQYFTLANLPNSIGT
ncbi:cuticle protein viking-like protein, partial [Euroglyphus maynei]